MRRAHQTQRLVFAILTCVCGLFLSLNHWFYNNESCPALHAAAWVASPKLYPRMDRVPHNVSPCETRTPKCVPMLVAYPKMCPTVGRVPQDVSPCRSRTTRCVPVSDASTSGSVPQDVYTRGSVPQDISPCGSRIPRCVPMWEVYQKMCHRVRRVPQDVSTSGSAPPRYVHEWVGTP